MKPIRSANRAINQAAETMADREDHGFARGLTNYGDRDFSLYLRRSFASSMGSGG
jgi:hypothetical protein